MLLVGRSAGRWRPGAFPPPAWLRPGGADLAAARADLAYALAHEKDNALLVAGLELCGGDEDAAAASYIGQLQGTNRETRQRAIIALAEHDPPDPRAPKSPLAEREERVSKRADDAAAMSAATGGPVRIHLLVEP